MSDDNPSPFTPQGQNDSNNPYSQPYNTAYNNDSQSAQQTNQYGNPTGSQSTGPQSPYTQPYTQTYTPSTPNPMGPPPQGAPTPGIVREPPLWMPWYGISFPEAIVRFFQKYITFSGRASRSEFWWSYLFIALVKIVLDLLASGLNSNFFDTLPNLWYLAVLIPSLAISVRRLHDTGRAGTWILLPYGLIVGGCIVMIVGGVATMFSVATYATTSYYSSSSSSYLLNSIGVVGLAILVIVAGLVVNIVLMALPSNPNGVRFDKPDNAPMPGQGPAPQQPTPGQNAYGQNPYGQSSYGQATYNQTTYGQTYGQAHDQTYAQQTSFTQQSTGTEQSAGQNNRQNAYNDAATMPMPTAQTTYGQDSEQNSPSAQNPNNWSNN